jgi:hypothetical protein
MRQAQTEAILEQVKKCPGGALSIVAPAKYEKGNTWM